jgi:hypothetical protein
MSKGSFAVLAAMFVSGVAAFASEPLVEPASPTKADHPLKTKTLVVIARDESLRASESPIQQFDKTFGAYNVDAKKLDAQIREAVEHGTQEGYRAFWVVATGSVASEIINRYRDVSEALSSKGATNYKVVLLNPEAGVVN